MQTRPLDRHEDVLWRALMRLTVTVPRVLGEDLERVCSLNGNEYELLIHLSEAPDRQLRMSDLADRVAVSRGRITRIVDELSSRGLVSRIASDVDRRSSLAVLTEDGFAVLQDAYPVALRGVRAYVLDHLDESEVRLVGEVLNRVAAAVDSARPPVPTRRV